MAIKKQIFQIKGMQRDLSKSKFNPEYAYTIYNMRVMPTDTSTLYSLINEKGTREVTIVDSSNNPLIIQGTSLGQCVINDRLIVFTTKPGQAKPDYIYKFILRVPLNTAIPYFEGEILYNGNLGFNIENPIECLTSYETEDVLKVYWVDGINPPRVINIESTITQRSHWNNTFFNFLPSLKLLESGVSVDRNDSGGEFPGGTIQYCMTYSNLNGQESKIAWISTLYYITNNDRAVGPDETCNCSYTISVYATVDTSFDFINLYSIIRTSYNSTPVVKLLTKLSTSGTLPLTYVDTNLYGTTVDPTEMFYKGGEYFKAKTLEAKDNTLFVGNVEVPYNNPGNLLASPTITVELAVSNLMYWKQNTLNSYQNQLKDISSGWWPITYLRDGNIYRLGVQLQDERGNWSDPIFIRDYLVKGFPKINYTNETPSTIGDVHITLPRVAVTFNTAQVNAWIEKGYKRIRPVIVLPSKQERIVIALGIVSPTVFTPAYRLQNNPYVLPSWFFRPYPAGRGYNVGETFDEHASVEGRHNHVLRPARRYNGECSFIEDGGVDSSTLNLKTYATLGSDESVSMFEDDYRFFVDSSIYTFNSPDLDDLTEEDLTGAHMRIVGLFFIDSSYADTHIEATPGNLTDNLEDVRTSCLANYASSGNSFVPFGFSGCTPWLDKVRVGDDWVNRHIAVFPWHRTGSLNNGPQSGENNAILEHKIMTNMRHSQTFVYVSDYTHRIWYSENSNPLVTSGIGKIKLCKEENEGVYGLDLLTIRDYYVNSLNGEAFLNYKNHIDLLINHTNKGSIPFSDTLGGELNSAVLELNTTTPIKYYSKTHAVITLNNYSYLNTQYTLPIPRHGDSYPSNYVPAYSAGQYPFWFDYGLGGSVYYPECKIEAVFNQAYGNYDFYNFLCNPDNPAGSPSTNFKNKEIMWIVELYRDTPANMFGGTSDEAKQQNTWIPASQSQMLVQGYNATIRYNEGDTIFNRWDCFKTLPYTTDDVNSVVEMMSFMCESYKNTAGRYDKLRGLADYSFVNRGTAINVYNDAYNNKDNFFNYRIRPESERKTKLYPNHIVWSLTKKAGEETDTWTQMTLASALELDGNKGAVTSLTRLNNDLICFQELGISLILYNESVQILSTTGVPIEIANSGKVLGKRYIDNIVGCSNKWSIAVGANGIYFIDDITKGIYQLGSKGLVEISDTLGFHSFINTYSVTTEPWNSKGNNRGCLTYYDKINGDVFFIWNTGICLCYSEALGLFMSFFPYKGPGFINISDRSFWIAYSNNPNEIGLPIKIWEHNGGEYNMFYNYCEPYGLTIIANQNPTTDKIFDNVEFRSDSWNINEYELPILEQTTFDTLVTETEYQRGISLLSKRGYRLGDRLYKEVVVLPWSTLSQMTVSDSTATESKVLYQAEEDTTDPTHSLHFYTFRPNVSLNVVDVTSEVTSVSINNPSTLKRKFRIWRALIPRNNSGTAVSAPSRDRMRNPWLTIHLYKYGAPLVGEFEWPPLTEEIPTVLPAGLDYGVEHKEKTVLHNIVVSYNE